MANLTYITGSLKLKINKGLDINDNEIIVTKSFSNVRESASAEDMEAVALAIGGLQKDDHYETQVTKSYVIMG